jgi:hypothetical protein
LSSTCTISHWVLSFSCYLHDQKKNVIDRLSCETKIFFLFSQKYFCFILIFLYTHHHTCRRRRRYSHFHSTENYIRSYFRSFSLTHIRMHIQNLFLLCAFTLSQNLRLYNFLCLCMKLSDCKLMFACVPVWHYKHMRTWHRLASIQFCRQYKTGLRWCIIRRIWKYTFLHFMAYHTQQRQQRELDGLYVFVFGWFNIV